MARLNHNGHALCHHPRVLRSTVANLGFLRTRRRISAMQADGSHLARLASDSGRVSRMSLGMDVCVVLTFHQYRRSPWAGFVPRNCMGLQARDPRKQKDKQ